MDLPLFVPRWMVRKMVDAAYKEGQREQFQEDSAAIDRVFKKDLADHGRLLLGEEYPGEGGCKQEPSIER
jgi:hypothetical protein